jgi:hypothetical protein
MINLDTCQFVVWGFKNDRSNSFTHIHEAFYRALKFMGKRAMWLDRQDDVSELDFSNTYFISMNYGIDGMPKREDCFYAIHNVESQAIEYLRGFQMMNYGLYISTATLDPAGWMELAPETFLSLQLHHPYSAVIFRWGTDLLPHEIEANKPSTLFRSESKIINYIGCSAPEWSNAIGPFKRAAEENGIKFNHLSGVSIEENVRLIRESYMAPAICPPWQATVGYVPCRLFKNISYGQYGVTNSRWANELFGGKLIYNPDARELFYQGRRELPNVPLADLHSLMDEVAAKHTYLNKIDAMLKATKIVLEHRQ